jgi:multimeric flavodoxin WrbA
MRTLLVVHHTASPTLEELLNAVIAGATTDEISGVRVEVQPALSATASDVLAADGFILGTPANIGYMSGALKHFFDQIYYPCRLAKAGAPYGLYVHGNSDTSGAVRAVETIATGMNWQPAHAPVTVLGQPSREDREACWDLGATLAAGLAD